ncbi:ATP-dependent DNA helicase UvrD/PcrA, clostridial paralog 2 [Sphingobacterium faecium PCAi_F2.5]|nr:ATP-dependent DNA helicase UvrD/PcrA, clostridial paralog 2 [Sphingobacterium faecium PCAi_F2.5]
MSAGPGAGKTYWLVNHIKNVLHNSDKLFITRKIACITYTNIAVETILKRLGTSSEQVEVSTIHSFLYKNVVKPYASFVAEEFGLNVAEMDGHDDIVLSNYSFLNDWKTKTGQQRIKDDNTVIKAFTNLKWKFENNELKAKTDYPFKVGNYAIKNDSYLEYKKMMWEKGLLHHDDILFFSFQIIDKFPFVINILNAKFPYIFIDEFQDSNPIQVEIFKKLGLGESKIGVIGDIAQSIYSFQGADYTQFQTFSFLDMKKYILNENRRSSNEIIDTLNSVRQDISQVKVRNISTEKPVIFIGDMTLALRAAKIKCNDESIYTLSRNNITSNAMKAEINGIGLNSRLLENLKETDSNTKRSNLIYACIKAIAYGKEGKFNDAIKELEKLFNYRADKIRGKRKALKYITLFLDKFAEYENATLLDFAVFIRTNLVSDLPNFKAGAIKTFYDSHTFKQLLLCVSIPEDMSSHKTIHKAKGDEFDNVLLVLREEKDINFLIEQNLLSNEEHRINYVAISRARTRLFISVPALSATNQTSLNKNFDIEVV